ncbi:hypothetical protein ARMSODRAFT_973602 [Armillaria solidipes]|uniref:Uncharacterized protein n=1 Tax=Armillaria solidipes TaxID=1076256 RepID=A0A2H3C2V0_9AGAR|nr:hypothetical protein ARMSODRAFT_973602 [Armillaria solidipes]
MSGIDSCLKIAKLTAAAGEFAPFPFIKGAAQCVVVVLETIESAAKNGKDLQELAESTVATLVVVRDTIVDHGPTSASCFKDICLDFQTYLNDLLSKLNKEGKPSGIRRLLKAKKISEDINAYRQRVQTAKDNFLIRTTTMTRLVLSDVHDEVTTGFSNLTGSMEASERNITSTIKDNIQEIRTWGARQSEDMQNLSPRLQGSLRRGLYKGSVWDIIPGDIHIIAPVTRSSTKCRAVRYQDSYCTIENSDTRKVIRKYQASGDDREDAMEQLDQALDFFMKQRHPNLPQIFGTKLIPFNHYLRGLPATRFTRFFSELFQDLQDNKEESVYVNEYGKLVFGDLLCYTNYYLGLFDLSYTQEHGKISLRLGIGSRALGNPLHSQNVCGQCDVVDPNLRPTPTPTPTIRVKWISSHHAEFWSGESGPGRTGGNSDEIVKSWIAQTSKLDSCLRSRGYGDDLEAYIIADVEFCIQILSKGNDDDFCHICNTKDQYHHALSLSITAPVIDYQTNTIESWPVVSCSRVCGMDLLLLEDIFTVEVRGFELQTRWEFERYMVHLTIPELNAEHGFDPACNGADVCEYFGWPLLEILDPSTGEWVLNGTTSQPLGPASVISDNSMPGQILSQEHDSAPRSTVGVATGRIAEETQAGEAPTIESRMVPVVQHDISTWALIVIFIAICIQVILLSSFKNYL